MSPRRILIVDDEPDMLQLLKRSLEPDLDCSVTHDDIRQGRR
jgi:CheY-like chemotaxis protein